MEATHCNFCGKHRNYVRKLVATVNRFNNDELIAICDECLIIAIEEIEKSDKVDNAANNERV